MIKRNLPRTVFVALAFAGCSKGGDATQSTPAADAGAPAAIVDAAVAIADAGTDASPHHAKVVAHTDGGAADDSSIYVAAGAKRTPQGLADSCGSIAPAGVSPIRLGGEVGDALAVAWVSGCDPSPESGIHNVLLRRTKTGLASIFEGFGKGIEPQSTQHLGVFDIFVQGSGDMLAWNGKSYGPPAAAPHAAPSASQKPPAPVATASCAQTAGAARAKVLVSECLQISPATHPPCNDGNPCSMITDEIARGCKMAGKPPAFCAHP
jgi:hypothetical protein